MKPRQKNAASGFTLIEVIITIVIVAVVGAMMVTYFGTSITQSSLPSFRLNAAAKLNDVLEQISARYSRYPQWSPNTTYAAGAVIIPSPTKRTGLLYTTTGGGTSGSSENSITWPLTMGGTTAPDGTVTWRTVWVSGTNGPAPALALTAWVANKVYSQQSATTPASIVYAGGNQYLCVAGSTSGGSSPTFGACTNVGACPTLCPDGTMTCINDNTVMWQYVGPAPIAVLQSDINTNATTTVFGRNYSVIHNNFIKFDTSVSPATEVDLSGTPTDLDYGKYLKVTIGMHSGEANRTAETLTTLFVLR
jgi:prepilin-type N-terminal cleavage/methylation domain-containing protein